MFRIVLHRPIYPRNIGMCARAMENQGVEQLVIIAGQCAIDSIEARQGAARAQEILSGARIYSNMSSYFQSESAALEVALSRREGTLRKTLTMNELVNYWKTKKGQNIAFHFGPEDDGLSLEEIEHCHFSLSLPASPKNPSYNLSHAVLLTLGLFQYAINSKIEVKSDQYESIVPSEFPHEELSEWLGQLGYAVEGRRRSALKTIKRLLMSSVASPQEIKVLRGILRQTLRKLK